MANQHLLGRIGAIRDQLMAGYTASRTMSSATKGREREILVTGFLERVLPPSFRFGTGDVTDAKGNRSGQVDVVVELPFTPSLPVIGGDPRLYLSEGVAAVLEVKSDLAGQWGEVVQTANAVHALDRTDSGAVMTVGDIPKHIPVLAIGFKGWKQPQTLESNVMASVVDAALVLEDGLFFARPGFVISGSASGPHALWALIAALHHLTNQLVAANPNIIEYIK